MATELGGEPQESWEQIGRRVEQRVRFGLGELAGAEPEDNWDTVGRKIEDRIKTALREWLKEE
ncbi:MAG: hypothetical protein WBB22_06790 [Anaerolineae bacterium]